jgi:hypothetical protein
VTTGTSEALAKKAVTPNSSPWVNGDRPVHVHWCPKGGHQWTCNSPYCNDMNINCPDDGGPTPIVQGYEPWRR